MMTHQKTILMISPARKRAPGEDFIFKDLNPAGERIGKVEREAVLGRSVRDVFPGVLATGLFDMAYGGSPTPAVVEARDRGLPTSQGLDMLVGQALVAFRIWTGQEVDRNVMKQAAVEEIKRRMEDRP